MLRLFAALASLAFGIAEREFAIKSRNVRRQFVNLIGGTVMALVSGWVGFLGVMFFAAALFFRLAGLVELVVPAVVTGTIVLLITCALGLEAWRRLKI